MNFNDLENNEKPIYQKLGPLFIFIFGFAHFINLADRTIAFNLDS